MLTFCLTPETNTGLLGESLVSGSHPNHLLTLTFMLNILHILYLYATGLPPVR